MPRRLLRAATSPVAWGAGALLAVVGALTGTLAPAIGWVTAHIGGLFSLAAVTGGVIAPNVAWIPTDAATTVMVAVAVAYVAVKAWRLLGGSADG